MKIDLRKDKGILAPAAFSAIKTTRESSVFDQSEEERIAEVMRRRLSGTADESETASPAMDKIAPQIKTPKVSRGNPVLDLALMILLILVTLYYLHDRGQLKPYGTMFKSLWSDLLGSTEPEPISDDLDTEDEGILPDHIFNELMPVTDDIAALADSLEETPLSAVVMDSLRMQPDSEEVYTPISEEPIQLSDDDILIINNRSLLLMVIELIGIYPPDLGPGTLFLKRDALTITAPRGGEWVKNLKQVLDRFVFGSFTENYSAGNARVSSKFDIIMTVEQDFQAQDLDALRLLDVLAHPFNDYLQQIVIDLSRQTDDNPAKFSFAGTPQEIQYVLSSWAESRCNFRLRSVSIDFKAKEIFVTLDVEFFNYRP